MAPSEEDILTNFLVLPSSLPTIISLEKFRELFPKRYRSHPQVRALYRELQYIRLNDLNRVRENIEHEKKRGLRQIQEAKRAYASSGKVSSLSVEDRIEVDIDHQLFGQTDHSKVTAEDLHTFSSLLADMETACAALEQEIEATKTNIAQSLEKITGVVSDLSDLRYGKMSRTSGGSNNLVNDTVDGLKQLEKLCRPDGPA
ncbi:Kinetochore subunit NKP2 [Ascosphaera apis ARSEF 7405]|uniref:Kinetochore subunit NKP2 n=1 Tax=Ascosphaera apis ARSEF 7405 TaxID=392613 RepID=A0A168BA36_9EURO|nr:Kinetochore subunit NKP2 [Ascosphaera apis ARSEF 7405]